MKTRHKTKEDICPVCNNTFKHYKWDNQKYCSKKCFYKHLKIEVECSVCGEKLLKPKSNFDRNKEHYCSRTCYNKRRKTQLKRLKRETEHFTSLVEEGCKCGVKEYYLLQIHHKDGNKNNNDPSNHEVVCANCHIKRHLKLTKHNKLVYHTKTLTSPEIIKIITCPR